MEAATEGQEQEQEQEREGSPPSDDPRFARARELGGGDHGLEMLAHAAQGAELDGSEERSGLDWLLGEPQPFVHKIPVDYETPGGMTKILFVVRSLDTRRIDKIEQQHFNQATGRVDRISADVQMVAEATTKLLDESGRETVLNSDEFLTVMGRNARGEPEPFKLAATTDALERRFHDQLGLLANVAEQIRRLAGFDPDRVGKAQRMLTEASLG